MVVVTTPPHHAFGSYRRPTSLFFVFAFAFAPAAPPLLSPLLLARHGGARSASFSSVRRVGPSGALHAIRALHACVLWYQETQNQKKKKKSKREENNTK